MCLSAIPMLGSLMSIGGSIASYMSQSSYASARQKLENEMAARNSELARKTAVQNYRALDDRELQVGAKISEQIRDITRQGQAARATASVAAAGANVTGRSVDEVLNQFEQRQLEFVNTAMQNKAFQRAQIDAEKQGAQITYEGRLLQSAPDLIQQPNFFASALGGFANAFNTGVSLQASIDPNYFQSAPMTPSNQTLGQLNYGSQWMSQFNPMGMGGG